MSPALNSEVTMGLLLVAVITTLIKYGLTINLSLTLLRDGVEKVWLDNQYYDSLAAN